MDQRQLDALRGHVLDQCGVIRRAEGDIEYYLGHRGLITDDEVTEGVWAAVQSLLSAAANLQKAFGGQGGRKDDERRPLRDAFRVDNSSPLRAAHEMRNHFDHLDERFERWAKTLVRMTHIDRHIGPTGVMANFDTPDRMRAFEPDTWDVIFQGDRINLRSLTAEADRILKYTQPSG